MLDAILIFLVLNPKQLFIIIMNIVMHKNYFKAQSTKEVRQKCLSHCYYVTNHKSDASDTKSKENKSNFKTKIFKQN